MRLSSRLRKLETARFERDNAPTSRHDWTRRWTHDPESHAIFEAAKAEAMRLAPGLARQNTLIDAGLCSVALTIGVELMADEVGGREQGERARLAFFEAATRYQRATGDLFPDRGFCLSPFKTVSSQNARMHAPEPVEIGWLTGLALSE